MTTVSPPASLRGISCDPSSDRHLVEAVIGGDHAALAAICARYRAPVQACVRRIVPAAPVEEIAQEVFARFWVTATHFDPQRGSLAAYFYVAARGKAIDWARSEAHRRRREDDYVLLADDHRGRHHPDAMEIRAAVEMLPRNELRAVWLTYYMGYSYSQAAIILDVPEGTAKSHIKNALRRLHGALDDETEVPRIAVSA